MSFRVGLQIYKITSHYDETLKFEILIFLNNKLGLQSQAFTASISIF